MNTCCNSIDSAQIQALARALAAALPNAASSAGSCGPAGCCCEAGSCACVVPIIVVCLPGTAS